MSDQTLGRLRDVLCCQQELLRHTEATALHKEIGVAHGKREQENGIYTTNRPSHTPMNAISLAKERLCLFL